MVISDAMFVVDLIGLDLFLFFQFQTVAAVEMEIYSRVVICYCIQGLDQRKPNEMKRISLKPGPSALELQKQSGPNYIPFKP